MTPNLMTLSHGTYAGPSGATGAATYQFFTRGYKPPAAPRDIEFDTVHNQNGKFKYVYDNGPGFRRWNTFVVPCQDIFQNLIGINGAQQYARLLEMWNHKGTLGMDIAGEVFAVHWAQETQEPSFQAFPASATAVKEYNVAVQFEEA